MKKIYYEIYKEDRDGRGTFVCVVMDRDIAEAIVKEHRPYFVHTRELEVPDEN